MRPAPAVTISIATRRAAHLMGGLPLAFSVAGALIWGLRKLDSPESMPMPAGLVASALLLAGISWLWRREVLSLRWNRGLWFLAPNGGKEVEGDVTVLVDVGPWMLLRFRASRTGFARWLSAHRAGAPGQWHALRCAVYSPRPAATPDVSAEEAAF